MLLSLLLLAEYFEAFSPDASILTSLRHFYLVHLRQFYLEDAFILGHFCRVLFETLMSSFILRRFCQVSFLDASVKFCSRCFYRVLFETLLLSFVQDSFVDFHSKMLPS